MVIERVKISNYRNLDGVDVYFHPDCNYIIGENNIGKSNLISLLNNVFNAKSFDDDDFADSDKEIVINITIGFQDCERSLLGDLLTSEDKGSVDIRISQRINDGRFVVTRTKDNKNCTLSPLRRISFISYESTLDPAKELKVDTKKGIGPLMRHIIEKSSHNYSDFLDSNQLKAITDGINDNYLSKIEGLKKNIQ